jgi:hypothetical protein
VDLVLGVGRPAEIAEHPRVGASTLARCEHQHRPQRGRENHDHRQHERDRCRRAADCPKFAGQRIADQRRRECQDQAAEADQPGRARPERLAIGDLALEMLGDDLM